MPLPSSIRPLVPHPSSVTELATAMDLSPQEVAALLASPQAEAWSVRGGTLLLTNVQLGHRADLHFYPSDEPVSESDLSALLSHLFLTRQFRVICAIVPPSGEAAALAKRLGFRQVGVLPMNRRINDSLAPFEDDLLFSLPAFEASRRPQVIHGHAT